MAATSCDRALLTLEHIVASSERTVPGTLSSVTDSWFQAPQNVISFSSLLVYFADGGQMAALRHTAAGLKKQPDVSSRGRSEADRLRWEILHNLRAGNEQRSWGLSWNHDLMSSWAWISALKSWPVLLWRFFSPVLRLSSGCETCTHWHACEVIHMDKRSFFWLH